MNRARSADSFDAQASRQVGWIAGFEYFSRRLMKAKASRMGRPKIIWAGEMLQSGSGVFLSWRSARRIRSLSSVPDEFTFDLRSLLAVLTATSARPFDCGWYADDLRCLTPHLVRNSCVALAMNSGPPSLDSSSGTPKVEKSLLKQAIRPRDPAWQLPVGVEKISGHPDRRSPTTR